MLGLNDNGHKWRSALCRALPTDDYDRERVVDLFVNAAIWAKTSRVPFDEDVEHAKDYMASLDQSHMEPKIPNHVRLYVAQELGLTLRSSQMNAQLPVPSVSQKRRAPSYHRPSFAMMA